MRTTAMLLRMTSGGPAAAAAVSGGPAGAAAVFGESPAAANGVAAIATSTAVSVILIVPSPGARSPGVLSLRESVLIVRVRKVSSRGRRPAIVAAHAACRADFLQRPPA